MATGTLIPESLCVGASLDGLGPVVRGSERVAPSNLSAEQRAAGIPAEWTLLVTYETERTDGSRLRNTEVLTFDGGRITRAEVSFGWNLQRRARARQCAGGRHASEQPADRLVVHRCRFSPRAVDFPPSRLSSP